jgi:hypothetical protein
MVHSPVQLIEPDWTYRYDADGPQAASSVRSLLGEVTDNGTLVLGTHFPTPTAGTIVTSADGLRFAP